MKEKKKRTKIYLWILVLAAIVGCSFMAWKFIFTKKPEVATDDAAKFQLEYTIKKSNLSDYLEIVGNVEAPIYEIRSLVSGIAKTVDVQNGVRVTKGATLASIEDLEYRLSYLKAKGDYENSLYEITMQQQQMLIQYEIAQQNLTETVILSPVSGVVADLAVKVRSSIGQNGIICSLVEDEQMYVNGFLDEVDLQKVKEGQKVIFEFTSFNLQLEGKVGEISKTANTTSGIVVIPVEFNFLNDPRQKGIIPGLSCTVRIVLLEKANAIAIPTNAVSRDQTGSYVQVKGEKEGDIQKVYVKTGVTSANSVEVTEGLSVGQKIIISASSAVLSRFSTQEQGGQTGLNFGMGGFPSGGGR